MAHYTQQTKEGNRTYSVSSSNPNKARSNLRKHTGTRNQQTLACLVVW